MYKEAGKLRPDENLGIGAFIVYQALFHGMVAFAMAQEYKRKRDLLKRQNYHQTSLKISEMG